MLSIAVGDAHADASISVEARKRMRASAAPHRPRVGAGHGVVVSDGAVAPPPRGAMLTAPKNDAVNITQRTRAAAAPAPEGATVT